MKKIIFNTVAWLCVIAILVFAIIMTSILTSITIDTIGAHIFWVIPVIFVAYLVYDGIKNRKNETKKN